MPITKITAACHVTPEVVQVLLPAGLPDGLLLASLLQLCRCGEDSLSAGNALAVAFDVFRGEEFANGALFVLLAVVDVLHQW